MAISKAEKVRISGLAQVESLQSEGRALMEGGKNANTVADSLLKISQKTSDELVSQMAMLAHAGISSGQLTIAATTIASVSDQIATVTNSFNLALRIADEGEKSLTFPFVAGKAASLLDFLKTLEKAITGIKKDTKNVNGLDELLKSFTMAKDSLINLKEKAEALVS